MTENPKALTVGNSVVAGVVQPPVPVSASVA
jgi:hypothetical protein